MKIKRLCRFLVLSSALIGVSGCAYPISKEIRREVTEDLTFPMVLENPTEYAGDIVLWGGKIIETINQKDGTEIIVLETSLDYLERPENDHESKGRFIAKTQKFLDPAIYKKGRKITVAGEIIGKETMPLGKGEYTYPVIMVKQLHLWKPMRYRYDYWPGYGPTYYDYWYSPWYYPLYYPYYGPYYWRY